MNLESRIPPQAKDLEKEILGVIMIEKEAFDRVSEYLTADCFYVDAHQIIFKAFDRMNFKRIPIDILTVVEELKRTDELEIVGGPFYISKLTMSVVSSANIETHAKILLEKSVKREIIKTSTEHINSAFDDTVDVFDLVNNTSLSITKIQENILRGKEVTIAQIADETHEEIIRTSEQGMSGYDTSIIALNKKILGWVAPDLIVLAARPGAGKTALALSSIKNLGLDLKIPTAFFSLEMNSTQIMKRMYSIDTGIHYWKINEGKLSEQEHDLLLESKARFSGSKIFIDDKGGISLNYLKTKVSLWIKKHGIKVVFVDYLQLMSGDDSKNKNRESIVSEISRGLKAIAKDYNIPIIALSQLNRAVESRTDKMPMLADLRESGAIEQDADIVLFLMRPEYYGMAEIEINGKTVPANGLVIGDVAKNRHGSTGRLKMLFKGELMKFTNYAEDFEHPKLIPLNNNFHDDNAWQEVKF